MNLSESYKKRIVELAGILEPEEDNYSSFKGVEKYENRKKDFFDSLISFSVIDDDKILEIFEFIGTEGYNNEEEAFEDFKEKIDFFKSMTDPVKMYRVIGVKNKKAIKTDNLGEHWTPYDWNLDGDFLMSIGYENWEEGIVPFVVEAMVPVSEIDVIQTIVQSLNFPNEHEVNLKNNAKGVKFIKSYKLDGF
jgi:hypothetical protein